jgi:predicted DNA-binding transcriptional regulator AlpA
MQTDAPSDKILPSRVVCGRFGRTSKTLDRWIKDDRLGFPRPMYIRNRRYFREAELIEWERTQASKPRLTA